MGLASEQTGSCSPIPREGLELDSCVDHPSLSNQARVAAIARVESSLAPIPRLTAPLKDC